MLELFIAVIVGIIVVNTIWWLVKKIFTLAFALIGWAINLVLYPFKLLFVALFGWLL